MSEVIERFLRYVKIDTQSDFDSETSPSTAKQFVLAELLKQELDELSLKDVNLDQNGYVMATLPGNTSKAVPTLGWIAHMDTSPDMSGKDVNPQFVENYDGKDIILNRDLDIILSPVEFPELKNYIGKTLITTDGNTLLGADDKAGIAAIMTAVSHLVKNPQIEHGTLKIGFTPDEEIGRGADRFDVGKFAAEFAYTVDGGELGEIEYENFNAAGAKIEVRGRGVHPGTAKDKMLNAIQIAMEINQMLPPAMRPETTAGYDGFFHLTRFDGQVEKTSLTYIIREHDRDKFEFQKRLLEKAVAFVNFRYGADTATLQLTDQYYNMREKILPHFHLIETAKEAMLALGIEPKIVPVRGGTDGARLSFEGLPCPNLFTGGHNAHGRYEFIPVHSLEKLVDVILKIIDLYTCKAS
jgi:tripeptide aminopeptidase